MPGWQSEEEHRVSINSLTSTQRLEKIVEKSKFGKVSRIESIANKIFPLSTSNRDPCYSLVLLCAWLSLMMAIFLFSTRIWFTPQVVTTINPYLIAVGAVLLATSLAGLGIFYLKNQPSHLKGHLILYVITFVLEISAWLIFLAALSVTSGPDSYCATQPNCTTISNFTLGFGIFFAVFSLLLLFLQVPIMLIFYDYYHMKLDQAERLEKAKLSNYKLGLKKYN